MRYRVILPFLTQSIYRLIHRHKLRNTSSNLDKEPFFILGSGRNGSTLLSMILNSHSQIFIPGEQFALHYAAIRFQLYNFLIWRDIVKIVIGEFADSRNNQGWNTNFNDLYSRLYQIPKKERSFQTIINEIVKETAKQNKENYIVWGDKSPSTIWFIKYIYRVYPNSKYVFLIRDGRDVISSYKEGGFELFKEMSHIKNAAVNWRHCVHQWNWLKKRVKPKQLLEIRYEDLVQEPELVVKEILLFLGLDYEEGILNYSKMVERRSILDMKFHQGLAKPIYQNSISKWKYGLNKEQLSTVLPIIEKELKKYDYV